MTVTPLLGEIVFSLLVSDGGVVHAYKRGVCRNAVQLGVGEMASFLSSVLSALYDAWARFKWRIIKELCRDIWHVTRIADSEKAAHLLLNTDHDPLHVFEQVHPRGEKVFRFVVFAVWLSETHPELA